LFLLAYQNGTFMETEKKLRKPEWLKIKITETKDYSKINSILTEHKLHTICSSGKCPNKGECWAAGTATLMILGDICSRACKFCATQTGKPVPVDENEPLNVAKAIQLLELNHCVITSVDRDDLADGGALAWKKTLEKVKEINPHVTVEALIPDFNGDFGSLDLLMSAPVNIISHNLETVRRLTPLVRSRASYDLSLSVLNYLANNGVTTKSGLMVGLGESEDEVYQLMDDLLNVGCRILTIGQYLQPSAKHLPVIDYVTPERFERYKEVGMMKGFNFLESSPLVRSSYHAEKHITRGK
jgi:lipoyl synthase